MLLNYPKGKVQRILTAVETCVRPSIGPSLASPKSESFGLKFSSSNTLEALKSRYITLHYYETKDSAQKNRKLKS